MATPQLYRQLFEQLGQWIIPKDLRHLKNCAEIVAAILASESACAAHWIPYLSHRDCQARRVNALKLGVIRSIKTRTANSMVLTN